MNELTLKEFSNLRVIYLYRPEGKGESGEVEYSFAEEAAKVTVRAENDMDNGSYYGHKAAKKVEEVVNRDNLLPRRLTQAWN